MIQNRRDFIKLAGLATGGLVSVMNAKPTLTETDSAIITTTDDSAQYTTREVRNHAVQSSYVGTPLSTTLNDAQGSTSGWELMGYSENIEHLNLLGSGSIIGSLAPPTEDDVGKEYTLMYRAFDNSSEDSGIVGIVDEEIDRYKTQFTIDYMANGQPTTVDFKAPNSVTKYLMGWNPNDPIAFLDEQQLDPIATTQLFVDYFARFQEFLTQSQYLLGRSRVVNRNTTVPVPDPNPVYGTLALLEAISEGDVLNHDELYPTLITLNMTDFS